MRIDLGGKILFSGDSRSCPGNECVEFKREVSSNDCLYQGRSRRPILQQWTTAVAHLQKIRSSPAGTNLAALVTLPLTTASVSMGTIRGTPGSLPMTINTPNSSKDESGTV